MNQFKLRNIARRVIDETYLDQRSSRGAGKRVIRSTDDEDDEREVDSDLEADPEDYATRDDMVVNAYARYKAKGASGAGLTDRKDLSQYLRSALTHDLGNRPLRNSPTVTDDELIGAAKDLYTSRVDLHAKYKRPNKIQGNVAKFINMAKTRKGIA